MSGRRSLPAEIQALALPQASVILLERMALLRWQSSGREPSENTIAAYRNDLGQFVAFCEQHSVQTPDKVKTRTMEAYLSWLPRRARRSRRKA